MGGKHTGANYDLAKAEADKVDAQIIETLKTGHSFRVEAGAGSGKTYSLNRVIEWIQANKWSDYSRKKQNVVCITYTNAAVDVIAERLAKDSLILIRLQKLHILWDIATKKMVFSTFITTMF